MKIITVFGSGVAAPDSKEYKTAYEVGFELGKKGFAVCNGGYGGIMEASAKGAFNAGAETIGITVEQYGCVPNPFIKKHIHTSDLFERAKKLLDIALGFVILPGGTGTMVELALSWELQRKGLSDTKPIVFLGDYWLPVLRLVGTEDEKENASLPSYIHVISSPKQAAETLADG